jgi:hypothetical protein
MADRDRTDRRQDPQAPGEGKPDTADPAAGQDPAVERGERIETGKAVGRGGKTTGNVPGTTGGRQGDKQ